MFFRKPVAQILEDTVDAALDYLLPESMPTAKPVLRRQYGFYNLTKVEQADIAAHTLRRQFGFKDLTALEKPNACVPTAPRTPKP